MKKLFLLFVLLCFQQALFAQAFSHYFDTTRLRVNLTFAGNAEQQFAYLESMNKEPRWGGSQTVLTVPFEYGEYCFKVFAADGQLIYSRGFNSLFYEWRTTDEAKKIARAYTSSIVMPMPKQTVRLDVYERLKATGEWQLLFTAPIDPADDQIQQEAPNNFRITQPVDNGAPAKKVDVVFIAEGYTAAEMDKFRADAARFAEYLFELDPFAAHRSDFNVWTVEAVSTDSGVDMPHTGSWKNTAADATFNTFGITRYLTVPDHKKISELAWAVPYDAIYVIANTTVYGGGGIYNFYGLSMADHPLAKEVFIHEFGHSFAGLGDEYYTSSVTYENFYNLHIEPWEPNLTTLVKFDEKWEDMVDKATPMPTPNSPEYADVTGVFEGGGYVTTGVFRPALDCRMKSNASKGFCPVCRRAIVRMIDSYTE